MSPLSADATLWTYAPDATPYEAAGVPRWLDDLSLAASPPFVKMGTRALPAGELFILDSFREHELALRNRLLDEQRATVFAARTSPAVSGASHEVLGLVTRWLAGRNLGVLSDSEHPLEQAARSVQEDLCVMVRHGNQWHLDAGVVCFPSLWSLPDRLGQPLDGLHEIVPHYASEVAGRVNTFLDRMRPGTAVHRRNLSIKPYPLLFLPVTKAEQPITSKTISHDGSPYWLRTEHQTLYRLPDSDAILFTIKLQMAPAKVLLERRDIARQMASMYRSWDAAMMAYKSGTFGLEHTFLPWLEQISADLTPH